MNARTASSQCLTIDKNPASSGTSTSKARLVESKAPYEGRYEALWNERGKKELANRKDIYEYLEKLENWLGSAAEVKRYCQWVMGHPLKRRTYVLSAYELALDLEGADWIKGSPALRNLNSRLIYSNTARQDFLDELKATYQGYRLALRIYGRPINKSYADRDECTEKGIAVNSELLLAVGYYPPIDPTVKTKPEKTTMLFAPLGYILINSRISGEWSLTELVLVAEVRDDGRAGSLHLIFPPKCPPKYGYSAEEYEELDTFHDNLPFTIAKLEDGLALLKGNVVSPDGNISPTVLSNLPVEVVETGVMWEGEPRIPFPLYPEDQQIPG